MVELFGPAWTSGGISFAVDALELDFPCPGTGILVATMD